MTRGIQCMVLFGVALMSVPARAEDPGSGTDQARRVSVGTDGWLVPGVLLQGWFIDNYADDNSSTFRLRRAELSIKGEVLPGQLSYALMIDPAKSLEFQDKELEVKDATGASAGTVKARQPASSTSILQDFYITAMTPWVDVSLGQFKLPVSWEGYNSSSKILFAERSLVSRTYGDKRDLGLRLSKSFKWFGYSAGLFNGAGLNNADTDNPKDGALRAEVYPFPGLVLAGMAYSTLWDRDQAGAKERYEADLRLDWKSLLFQSEYIRARDVGAGGGATRAEGFYGALAIRLLDGRLEPCVRIGWLDPDLDEDIDPAAAKGADESWQYAGGINYYLQKHEAKLQINYTRYQYDDATANNEVIFAAQVAL